MKNNQVLIYKTKAIKSLEKAIKSLKMNSGELPSGETSSGELTFGARRPPARRGRAAAQVAALALRWPWPWPWLTWRRLALAWLALAGAVPAGRPQAVAASLWGFGGVRPGRRWRASLRWQSWFLAYHRECLWEFAAQISSRVWEREQGLVGQERRRASALRGSAQRELALPARGRRR
jgi:hypothetical protein